MSSSKLARRMDQLTHIKKLKHAIKTDAKRPYPKSPADLYDLSDNHDSVRQSTADYKDRLYQFKQSKHKDPTLIYDKVKKRTNPLSTYSSIHYGLTQQQRHRGFKKSIDSVVGDKKTKHQIRDKALQLANRYQEINKAGKKGHLKDRKYALKAAKHMDMRLEPINSTTKWAYAGWRSRSKRPADKDKSLHAAIEQMEHKKEKAFGAITNSMYGDNQSEHEEESDDEEQE